jgi:hypothetical protein
MLYEAVFNRLEERKVRYVVVGGVALVLHGVIRLTADLDLMVDFSPENLSAFVQAMNELGYRPKAPVPAEAFIYPENRQTWAKEKGMKAFGFYHHREPMNSIDVLVDEPIPFSEIEANKVVFRAKGIAIPVVSRAHLKQLKRLAGRPQDIADIDAMNELEGLKD